jgi:DNA-directed RNA polymerase omega subunit
MSEMYNSTRHDVINAAEDGERWPGVDSRFRLVIVAALRSKQIQRGARPRIEADPKRRRSTSIALEEVKLGLISFVNNTKDDSPEGGDGHAARAGAGDTVG